MLLNAAKCQGYSFYRFWVINPNKAGLFEGSFFWAEEEGRADPPNPFIFQEEHI